MTTDQYMQELAEARRREEERKRQEAEAEKKRQEDERKRQEEAAREQERQRKLAAEAERIKKMQEAQARTGGAIEVKTPDKPYQAPSNQLQVIQVQKQAVQNPNQLRVIQGKTVQQLQPRGLEVKMGPSQPLQQAQAIKVLTPAEIDDERRAYIDELLDKMQTDYNIDREAIYRSLAKASKEEIKQAINRLIENLGRVQQKLKEAQAAEKPEETEPGQQHKDTDIIAVAQSTNPDKFLVYYVDDKGYTRTRTMTRQEVIDAGGEIPVGGSGWWGNPGTRGEKIVPTQGVTETEVKKLFEDLGLEAPDFTNAPGRKLGITVDGMLDGIRDENGDLYIAHPSTFGKIEAAVKYANSILDPKAKAAYLNAFKYYWGVDITRAFKGLPTDKEKIAGALGFKRIDDKAFQDTLKRFKENPYADEFKLVEAGGTLTLEQKEALAKIAIVQYNGYSDWLNSTVLINTNNPASNERIAKAEYEKLKKEDPGLAAYMLKFGAKAAGKKGEADFKRRVEDMPMYIQMEYKAAIKDGRDPYEAVKKASEIYNNFVEHIDKLNEARQQRSEARLKQAEPYLFKYFEAVKKSRGEKAAWAAVNDIIEQNRVVYEKENIKIGNQYMNRADFEALDEKYQKIARAKGFDEMNNAIKVDNLTQDATLQALAWTKNEKGEYDKKKLAFVLRNNPIGETLIRNANFKNSEALIQELNDYNNQPWVKENPYEKLFKRVKEKYRMDIARYLSDTGLAHTELGEDKVKYLFDVVYKDAEVKKLLEATKVPVTLNKPDISKEEFIRLYLEARGIEDVPTLTTRKVEALKESNAREEGALEYSRLYGKIEFAKSTGTEILSKTVFSPARVLYPEVTIDQVKPLEWAAGVLQVGLLAAPGIGSAVGKATTPLIGRLTAGAINAAAAGVFIKDTADNWRDMSPGQLSLAIAMDTAIVAAALLGLGGIKGRGAVDIANINQKAGQAVTNGLKIKVSPEVKAYNAAYDTTKSVIKAVDETTKIANEIKTKAIDLALTERGGGMVTEGQIREALSKALTRLKVEASVKTALLKSNLSAAIKLAGEQSGGRLLSPEGEGIIRRELNKAIYGVKGFKLTAGKLSNALKWELTKAKAGAGRAAGTLGGEKGAAVLTEGQIREALNKALTRLKVDASIKAALLKSNIAAGVKLAGEEAGRGILRAESEGIIRQELKKAIYNIKGLKLTAGKLSNAVKWELTKAKASSARAAGKLGSEKSAAVVTEGQIREALSKALTRLKVEASVKTALLKSNLSAAIKLAGEQSGGRLLSPEGEGIIRRELAKLGYKVKGGKLIAKGIRQGVTDAAAGSRKASPEEIRATLKDLVDAIMRKDAAGVEKAKTQINRINKTLSKEQADIVTRKTNYVIDKGAEIVKITEKRLSASTINGMINRMRNNLDFIESPSNKAIAQFNRLNEEIGALEGKLAKLRKETPSSGPSAEEYINNLKEQLSTEEGRLAAFRRGETSREIKSIFEKRGRLKEYQKYRAQLKQVESLEDQLKNYRNMDDPNMIARADTIRRQISFLKIDIASWEARNLTSSAASRELQAALDKLKAERDLDYRNNMNTAEDRLNKLRKQRAAMLDRLSKDYGIKVAGQEPEPPASGRKGTEPREDIGQGGGRGGTITKEKVKVKPKTDVDKKVKPVEPDIDKLKKAREAQKEKVKTEEKTVPKKETTKTRAAPGTDRPVKLPQIGDGPGYWALVWENGRIFVKWMENKALPEGWIRWSSDRETITESAQRLKHLLKADTLKQAIEKLKKEYPGEETRSYPFVKPSPEQQPQPEPSAQPQKQADQPKTEPDKTNAPEPTIIETPVPVTPPETAPEESTKPGEATEEKPPVETITEKTTEKFPPDERDSGGKREGKEWTKEEFNSALKWKDGFIIHALKAPFRKGIDARSFHVDKLPAGFDASDAIEKYNGPGSQQSSARVTKDFPKRLSIDVGNQNVTVTRIGRSKKVRMSHAFDKTGTVSQATIKRNNFKQKTSLPPGVITRQISHSLYGKSRRRPRTHRRRRIIY